MMGASRTLVLMYHQIEPSGVPDGWVPNALADARYGVGLSDFREQMDIIRDRKIPVVRLSDCLEGSAGSREPLSIVVTFDDGYASDLELAAPILEKLGIPATFFSDHRPPGQTRHAHRKPGPGSGTLPAF